MGACCSHTACVAQVVIIPAITIPPKYTNQTKKCPPVQLIQMHAPSEVECERARVADTLHGRVHEARVAQVVEARGAAFRRYLLVLVDAGAVLGKLDHLLRPSQVLVPH